MRVVVFVDLRVRYAEGGLRWRLGKGDGRETGRGDKEGVLLGWPRRTVACHISHNVPVTDSIATEH